MTDSSHRNRRTPPSARQATMLDQTETFTSSPSGRTLFYASINMKGTHSLARLRDRIDLTVRELARLRNENKKIRRDLEKAANHPSMSVEGTPVVFSESSTELRSRIERYIKAIDAHMNEQQFEESQVAEKQEV